MPPPNGIELTRHPGLQRISLYKTIHYNETSFEFGARLAWSGAVRG